MLGVVRFRQSNSFSASCIAVTSAGAIPAQLLVSLGKGIASGDGGAPDICSRAVSQTRKVLQCTRSLQKLQQLMLGTMSMHWALEAADNGQRKTKAVARSLLHLVAIKVGGASVGIHPGVS